LKKQEDLATIMKKSGSRGSALTPCFARRVQRVNDDESTGSLAFLLLIALALMALAFLWTK
jgi:hypothetical protein